MAARLETLALRKTAGVFCNSAYTQSLVAPRTPRVWRVPNAVRPAFFAPQSEAPRSAPPILLNVGVLSPRKRQTELLEVARQLWERGLRFELQFIGETDTGSAYGADFMRRISEAQKIGYARHIGLMSVDSLIAAFDRASALVHFPAEEAFGLVVAEALARNLKFFGARVGGVGEIAGDVEGAELFPESDWSGLGNAIGRWIEAGCQRPGDSAKTMRERYHPNVIARRHLEIYREVLATRS